MNKQYQTSQSVLEWLNRDIVNHYYFKYSDIKTIESLLKDAGYIEETKKPVIR